MGELCVLPIGGEHGFGIDSFLYGHPTADSLYPHAGYKLLRVSPATKWAAWNPILPTPGHSSRGRVIDAI